jgi:hypothetical protein
MRGSARLTLLGAARRRASSPECDHALARMLARDLTAPGMVVDDSSKSVATGGVWLAPCPDYLAEVLRILGYVLKGYGSGGAHVVIGPR